jgi:hypothetical protein
MSFWHYDTEIKERQMISSCTRSTLYERVAVGRLIWVGPLTITLAVAVNLIVRSLAVTFFGVSASFPYLQVPVIVITTLVFLVVALLVFVLIGRVSEHPVRTFRIVGSLALLLSFLNPVLQLAGHWLPATGMNLSSFWAMIVMHLASALITIILFTTLAIEQREGDAL